MGTGFRSFRESRAENFLTVKFFFKAWSRCTGQGRSDFQTDRPEFESRAHRGYKN